MPYWNWASFITFIIFISLLLLIKAFKGLLNRPIFLKTFYNICNKKLIKICPSRIPVPSEIIAVVTAIIVSHFTSVQDIYPLETIGKLPIG